MTLIEVLSWMHRGYALTHVGKYGRKGEFWYIAGERCTPAVNAGLRNGLLRKMPARAQHIAVMTKAGKAKLADVRARELAKERR